MPKLMSMQQLQQGVEVVEIPEIKMSKYEFLTDQIRDAGGRAVKVNRQVFEVASSKQAIKSFIWNISTFYKGKFGVMPEGMSQNGSIYFWEKQ